jgi:hypothetical protein
MLQAEKCVRSARLTNDSKISGRASIITVKWHRPAAPALQPNREFVHQAQSHQAMSNNRLILVLGVGSGSTRDDFELFGYDYDHRFRTFKDDLEIMNRV